MELTHSGWLCNAGDRTGRKLMVLLLLTGVLWITRTERANAVVTTTTVQGTIYLANGQPGSGMLHVSWPGFTSANGQAIVADSVDVAVGGDGFLSVNLAPNQGAMPAGLFYTAVFYMSDGSVSTQYWVVPAAAQATLAQVQAQVMPAAQAVQAVSKVYVDQAIAQLSQSVLTGSGGTLTGPLYLNADPTQPLQAADKHYVDLVVGQSGSNHVDPASPGQIAYYSDNGTSLKGVNTVPVTAGGTGSATSAGALENLGGISLTALSPQTMSGPLNLSGSYDSSTTNLNQAATAQNVHDVAPRSVKEFGAKGDGMFSDFEATAGSHTIQLVDVFGGIGFTAADVGKLILLPMVDSDHGTLYTTISGYVDSTHVTVTTAPTYTFDGTGQFGEQALWATDDLAALNSAITAVKNQAVGNGGTREDGGALYVPCGYYGVSSQLSIPGGISIQGESPNCAVVVYMGASSVDAAVEVSPDTTQHWLRANGFYMDPTVNNHPEIGQCTGAACSPLRTGAGSMNGSMHDLAVYGNKHSAWGLSIMFPANYQTSNLRVGPGLDGCFYNVTSVQTTFSDTGCVTSTAFGTPSLVNGMYFDGSAGGGTIPMKIQSPWVTNATGTGITFNGVMGATLADAQVSVNNVNLNVTGSTTGVTFIGDLLEAGVTPEIIAGENNVFVGTQFTGTGVTISGPNNSFTSSLFPGGAILIQSTAINTSFTDSMLSPASITDNSNSAHFSHNYDWNSGTLRWSLPTMQESSPDWVSNNEAQAVVHVMGMWRFSSAHQNITTTKFVGSKSWKAIFIGNWYYYTFPDGVNVPTYLELTDVANSITFASQTVTFGLDSNGHFYGTSSTGSGEFGFTGTVIVVPRLTSPGSPGSNSMQLAGNLTVPTLTIPSAPAGSYAKADGRGYGIPLAVVASGTLTLATSAIASGACQAVTAGSINSAAAAGVLTTDTVSFTPNGSIKAVTGYTPGTTGGLAVTAYPTSGYVNFDVCNWSASSITPGAVTLNWKVTR